MKNPSHDLTLVAKESHEASQAPSIGALPSLRVAQAKAAYTTRRVPLSDAVGLLTGKLVPRPGDLVLARVTRPRQHTRIELANGRRARLHVGDEIIVCYGNRYAPDQFEAVVPGSLEPCHLVAAGGIAARSLSRSAKVKPATEIEPLGLLADAEGQRLNLGNYALERPAVRGARPFTVAVVGTSMNAGKTTTAGYLIKGLSRSGLRVGGTKVTGTGAGGDYWFMRDSGASEVVDFTDAGAASTYRASRRELEEIALTLTQHLQSCGSEAIVIEVADGLFQDETAALLSSPAFRNRIDGVIFAAGDAMGASAGVAWLERQGLPVLAVSGALTASPLAVREAQQATALPVLDIEQLADAEITARLAARLKELQGTAEAV